MTMLENRIMELEIKSAHQEDTIEQLNCVIIEHQAIIASLKRQMEQLQNRLSSMQEDNSKQLAEPPPPHY